MLPKQLSRKKLLIFGCIVLGLLLILLVSLIKQRNELQQKMLIDQQGQTGSIPQVSTPEFQTVNVPQTTFKTYNTNSANVTLPPKVKTYAFRTDYSQPSLTSIANKFGLTENKSEGNSVILYNQDNETNRGYLTINAVNGSYDYKGYGSYKIPATGANLSQNVRNFLLDADLIDETVDCNITYQRTDAPDLTFVECHRDWIKAGLPIINFVGLLNVPDLKPITSLAVGMSDQTEPDDPNITNVSTGQNGYARPNDFNTVTVGVDNNASLVSISSNIKMLESSAEYNQSDIITPEEAVETFRQGNSQLTLIVPTDDQADWQTVFPDNTAFDLDAQISDIILAYIEIPFSGTTFSPMYLVRGNAQTSNGNSVKFLQAIPALRSQQVSADYGRDVAGLMAQAIPTDDPTLKLKTFQPEQRTATETISGESCVPAESQLSPIITLGVFGQVGKWTIASEGQKRSGNWYLIPASTQVLPDINSVVSSFDQLELSGKGEQLRELDKLEQEWNQYKLCPLRVTGTSPSIFVYGIGNYSLSVGRKLTYAYPQAVNNTWNVTGSKNNYIYYEYQPVWFTKPENGWNVEKSGLTEFAQTTGSRLGLTAAEVGRLTFELKTSASQLAYDRLFVGLIDNNELNQKVPLSVSPAVQVERYHFFVTKADGNVTPPQLTPVLRTPEMLLEVGAVAQ